MFFNRTKDRKDGNARPDLLEQLRQMERQAAEITFRRNVIVTWQTRRDSHSYHALAGYGIQALGRERAAQIARNLELSGTCPGLGRYIESY